MARRARWVQQELRPRTWGGARDGAGRRRMRPSRVPHRPRREVRRLTVVHVTVKLLAAVGRLRRYDLAPVLRRCLAGAALRDGFRIVHFSIQRNHIHLLTEATSSQALARGMQSFQIRLARRLNRRLGRSGRVVADRYHDVHVTTPRQARAALLYVLGNARRHGEPLEARWGGVDPFSSACYFTGWATDEWRARVRPPRGDPPVASPVSWLLQTGWRRHGLIGPSEVPPAGAAR